MTEWAIDVGLAVMFGMCALMMLRMMVRGCRGAGRHARHGMMCMGHDAEGSEGRTFDEGRLEELKVERDRLELLIATADRARMAKSNS